MKKEKKKLPTDAELELLQVLWAHKGLTVREVHDLMSGHKSCAYTTTLKIIQKMTVKGLVKRTVTGQVHTYEAAVEESKVRNSHLKNLIDQFFKGSYAQLALHALGQSPKEEDLTALAELVDRLKLKKKSKK
jgi:BlaI family transcriptional regulator, penicillinase repressor